MTLSSILRFYEIGLLSSLRLTFKRFVVSPVVMGAPPFRTAVKPSSYSLNGATLCSLVQSSCGRCTQR